jgi:hypothetical protein
MQREVATQLWITKKSSVNQQTREKYLEWRATLSHVRFVGVKFELVSMIRGAQGELRHSSSCRHESYMNQFCGSERMAENVSLDFPGLGLRPSNHKSDIGLELITAST